VTQGIFGINVAVFLGMVLAGISITDPTPQQLLDWGANWAPLTLGGQWWRLLTCTFLHIGVIHIAFNMWCLWDLGGLCESLYGHWTFAAVYLICGIGGSLASVTWNGSVSAGASGAIFGLAGALIASYYLGEFSLPRNVVTATGRSVVIFVGYNLVFGYYAGFVDNYAHVGGLVTGLILGALIARLAPDSDNLVRRGAVVLFGLLAVFAGMGWLRYSRSPLIHVQQGARLLRQNQTEQAVAEFQIAIRQRPGYEFAHLMLAQAYSNSKQYARAEAELTRVIELEPNAPEAYYDLGYLYLESHQPSRAREAFAKILSLHPNDADAHFGLGEAAAADNNCPEAIQEYETAAKLDSQIDGVYYRTGICQAKLQMYDAAIASYLKEQESSGDSHDIEIALADAYHAQGKPQASDEAMQKADKLKPAQ
jgi:membrane associated rhomboid family serine protease/Flp pilus assembly protein TadD